MLVKLRRSGTDCNTHSVVLGLTFHDAPYLPLATVWTASDSRPTVVHLGDCDIVDANLPPDWAIVYSPKRNIVRLGPSEFLEEGFWSRVRDGDEAAIACFSAIANRMLRFHTAAMKG
jgi:hypothetical protein